MSSITILGSVNLDIVARVEHLPGPGETVSGASLARYPGGKGANQALAARRLGADVKLIARVGADAAADEALALLRADGVDLSAVSVDATAPTGHALIAVAANGENQIVVAPGANACLLPDHITLPPSDALICQLEVPVETVRWAVTHFKGLSVINLAPALPVPDDLLVAAGLIIVNETEAAYYGAKLDGLPGLIASTRGAAGAVLKQAGIVVAEARPPKITPVDTTGAGDCFVGALTVALLDKMAPADALAFACAAGAAAALTAGAQPSLPRADQVRALMGKGRA